VLDDFLKMLDVPVKMLDSPPRKAKGMLNVFLQMLNKKDRSLNIWQKMMDILLRMWNDPEPQKMKDLDLPVRVSMNIENSFSM